MQIDKIIVSIIFMSFLTGEIAWASSGGHDPLSIFNPYSKKAKVHISNKKTVVRYVASKRSLASYGRMGGEYLGPVTNSEATKVVPADKYSMDTMINNKYLELKAIDGPMPEDYARLKLKSKTLLSPTKNSIKIVINKRNQRMYVYDDLEQLYTFKVSTGRRGHNTPAGVFKPYSAEQMHYSRKYYNSPMPWSVFFNGGVAIHGTEAIRHLGHRTSHGCVRTHPKSARRIYHIVRKYGMNNTTAIVTN